MSSSPGGGSSTLKTSALSPSSLNSPSSPSSPVLSPSIHAYHQQGISSSSSSNPAHLKKRLISESLSRCASQQSQPHKSSSSAANNSSPPLKPLSARQQCLLLSLTGVFLVAIVSLFFAFIYYLIQSHLEERNRELPPPVAREHYMLGSVRVVRPNELPEWEYPVKRIVVHGQVKHQSDEQDTQSLIKDPLTGLYTHSNHHKQRDLSDQEFDLVIGMNTLKREQNAKEMDYLTKSVESLVAELDRFEQEHTGEAEDESLSPPPPRVLVLIHNLPRSKFEEQQFRQSEDSYSTQFDALRQRYASDQRLVFYKVNERFWDPFVDNELLMIEKSLKPDNSQSAYTKQRRLAKQSERQHNCDIASLGTIALHHIKFKYFMFLEDDYVTCPGAMGKVLGTLQILEQNVGDGARGTTNAFRAPQKICSLRVSYGTAGVILPRKELTRFVQYVEANIDLHTVDQLLHNFLHSRRIDPGAPFCPTRKPPHIAYTYERVLFEHIGEHSVFEERNGEHQADYPKCDFLMRHTPYLDQDEEFDEMRCFGRGVSPCKGLELQ